MCKVRWISAQGCEESYYIVLFQGQRQQRTTHVQSRFDISPSKFDPESVDPGFEPTDKEGTHDDVKVEC